MNQKVLFGIVIVLLLVGGFMFFKPQEANGPTNQKMITPDEPTTAPVESVVKESAPVDMGELEGKIIYYYGEACPHCQDVNKFLEENNIADKVDFIKKEVWSNQVNNNELGEVAQKCGLNPGNIGVPFLFAEGKCYMGGPDVEGFFSKKAGL